MSIHVGGHTYSCPVFIDEVPSESPIVPLVDAELSENELLRVEDMREHGENLLWLFVQ